MNIEEEQTCSAKVQLNFRYINREQFQDWMEKKLQPMHQNLKDLSIEFLHQPSDISLLRNQLFQKVLLCKELEELSLILNTDILDIFTFLQDFFEEISQNLPQLSRLNICIGQLCNLKCKGVDLGYMINKVKNIKEMSIAFEDVTLVGQFYPFFQSISQLPAIQTLSLTFPPEIKLNQDRQAIPYLLYSLRSQLTSLSLNFTNNNLEKEGFQQITQAIQSCKLLTKFEIQLYGENLDAEQMESLRLSLWNCKLQELKIILGSKCYLRDSGIVSICKLIRIMSTTLEILHFGINQNNIGEFGSVQISECLSSQEQLRELTVSIGENNKIGLVGLNQIFYGINRCLSLITLNLCVEYGNNLAMIADKNCFQLTLDSLIQLQKCNIIINEQNNFIPKQKPEIKKVKRIKKIKKERRRRGQQYQMQPQEQSSEEELSEDEVSEQQGNSQDSFSMDIEDQQNYEQIRMKKLPNLKEFNLEISNGARLGFEGCKNIFAILTSFESLEILDIKIGENNKIQENETKMINYFMQFVNKKLHSLSLNISDNEFKGVSDQLFFGSLYNFSSLKSLSLHVGQNCIKSLGIEEIKAALIKNNQSLKELELTFLKNNIGQYQASVLAAGLSSCKSLEILGLSFYENVFTPAGISEIGMSIGSCGENIKQLRLQFQKCGLVGDKAILTILKGLSQCKCLTDFYLSLGQFNGITDQGIILLSVFLAHKSTLENLAIEIHCEKLKTIQQGTEFQKHNNKINYEDKWTISSEGLKQFMINLKVLSNLKKIRIEFPYQRGEGLESQETDQISKQQYESTLEQMQTNEILMRMDRSIAKAENIEINTGSTQIHHLLSYEMKEYGEIFLILKYADLCDNKCFIIDDCKYLSISTFQMEGNLQFNNFYSHSTSLSITSNLDSSTILPLQHAHSNTLKTFKILASSSSTQLFMPLKLFIHQNPNLQSISIRFASYRMNQDDVNQLSDSFCAPLQQLKSLKIELSHPFAQLGQHEFITTLLSLRLDKLYITNLSQLAINLLNSISRQTNPSFKELSIVQSTENESLQLSDIDLSNFPNLKYFRFNGITQNISGYEQILCLKYNSDINLRQNIFRKATRLVIL